MRIAQSDLSESDLPRADPSQADARVQAPPPADASSRFIERIRRHLAVLVAAKIVFLILLYAVFFSPSQRPEVTPARVDRHLFPNE